MSHRKKEVVWSEPSKPSLPRNALKVQLFSERAIYLSGLGWWPLCPFCRQPLTENQGDLHEGLINRGKLPGHVKQDLIFTRYNCVLVCHKCHMRLMGVGGDDGFNTCAKHIIAHEGRAPVEEWLQSLVPVFPQVAKEALARLQQVPET